MSHDTHDQNKGLETADTAPSRMRVLAYALLGYLLVACIGGFFLYGIGDTEQPAASSAASAIENRNGASFPPAAYFTDSTNLNLINEQIQLGNLHMAADRVELATVLGTFPEIRIIFLDPSILKNEDHVTLIRQQFELGKMIVGLRTPHAELSQKLELTPQSPELTQSETINSVIWISGWYLDENGSPVEIVATWDQFPTMLTTLHALPLSPQ